jgi:hypothetical protein
MHRMQAQGATERPVVDSTAFDRARSVPDRSIRSSPATPMTAAEGVGLSGGAYNDLRHKPFSPHGQTSSGSPSQRSEKEEFQDIFSELMTGTEHEVAFLTRHFSEIVGPWCVPMPWRMALADCMQVGRLRLEKVLWCIRPRARYRR